MALTNTLTPGVLVTGAAMLVLSVVHAGDGGRSSPARTLRATTRVTAIYPPAARGPAHLLKLYVEFSAAMSDGEAEQRLHLYDARGHEMPRAFLHVDAELWNDTHTRLTVLFDPGRIKRGLRANLEEGAPLTEGETFTLRIDPAWRDARGATLTAGFRGERAVGAAGPRAAEWARGAGS